MSKYIFDALADIDLVELIESMGFVLKKAGHTYKMSCPLANGGDSNPSFTVNTKTNRFYCWHCAGQFKGDALDFVMGVENISRDAALAFLAKRYPFIVNPDADEIKNEQTPEAKAGRAIYSLMQLHKRDHEKYTRQLIKDTEACEAIMKNRGLSKETLGEFGIGIATWGRWPRITIPNMDVRGRIVSFTTRKLVQDDPRAPYLANNVYIKPIDGSPFYERVDEDYKGKDLITVYEKGSWLYRVFEAAISGETIYIVEGHFDVIAMWELGFRGAVALGTNVLYETQASQLRAVLRKAGYTGPIILVPDNDDPGRKTFFDNYKVLRSYFPDTVIGFLNVAELADPMPEKKIEFIKDMGDVAKVKGLGGHVYLGNMKLVCEAEARLASVLMFGRTKLEAKAKLGELLRIATEPFGRAALIGAAAERLDTDPLLLARVLEGGKESDA